jgi:hypothetical protein
MAMSGLSTIVPLNKDLKLLNPTTSEARTVKYQCKGKTKEAVKRLRNWVLDQMKPVLQVIFGFI